MAQTGNSCFTPMADGVRLAVRLTPRAGRNLVDGVKLGADGRALLHLRLAAPPVDGAANAALIGFLADALGLRRADIRLLSGASGRVKMLHLAGDTAAIMTRLSAWIGDSQGRA